MTYDTQGRRVLQGHPSTYAEELEQVKAALRNLLDAMDAVDAEAKRAEQPGATRWSSAPVVWMIRKRTEARAALTDTSGGASRDFPDRTTSEDKTALSGRK